MSRVMTGLTDKLRLRLAVCLFAVTASRARSAGVTWVNMKDAHASDNCLVFDECAELPESPIVVFRPLTLSNRRPRPDALQFFDGKRAIRVLSLANE